MVNTIYLLSFVETPRKFIIAELSISIFVLIATNDACMKPRLVSIQLSSAQQIKIIELYLLSAGLRTHIIYHFSTSDRYVILMLHAYS